jgi:hypothetical protein
MTNTKQLKAGAVVEFMAEQLPDVFETAIAEINLVTTRRQPRYTTDYWGRTVVEGYDEAPAYEMVGWRGTYYAEAIMRVVKSAPQTRPTTQAERDATIWNRAAGHGAPSPDALRAARSRNLKPVLVEGGTWRVQSQHSGVWYTVRVESDAATSCNCADAHAGHVCKHQYAVLRECRPVAQTTGDATPL